MLMLLLVAAVSSTPLGGNSTSGVLLFFDGKHLASATNVARQARIP
jgi:hypothetical protein